MKKTRTPMLNILYEDKHLIICVKPPGVPAQPDPTGAQDMTALLREHFGSRQPAQLGIVHRLDRPVGGLMVYTKTREALAFLNKEIQAHRFEKKYLAVCCGAPELSEGSLCHWLVKDARTNASRIVPAGTAGAKEALLDYRVLRQLETPDWGTLTLMEVTLRTGRHHQIRVQLTGIGCPLWGDTKYNPAFQDRAGWHAIALWSETLGFRHPFEKKRLTYSLPPTEPPFDRFLP